MAIAHCEYDDTAWDDDAHDRCPACEAHEREEESYWRQLWNGEQQAGLVGDRSDDPAPPIDPRTAEYWGI